MNTVLSTAHNWSLNCVGNATILYIGCDIIWYKPSVCKLAFHLLTFNLEGCLSPGGEWSWLVPILWFPTIVESWEAKCISCKLMTKGTSYHKPIMHKPIMLSGAVFNASTLFLQHLLYQILPFLLAWRRRMGALNWCQWNPVSAFICFLLYAMYHVLGVLTAQAKII